VNCPAVRERLAEKALGVISRPEEAAIDRHLAWCAACRKEADDLTRAAAVLPYTLAPAVPSEELAGRIGKLIAKASAPHRGDRRRGRAAAAAAVAAIVAVAALGWGAAMAGRADRLREQMLAARQQQQVAIQRFSTIIHQSDFQDPRNEVFVGTLSSFGGPEGGAALALTSPKGRDFAIVSVDGLPAEGLPYTVMLERPDGTSVSVGKIVRLDTGGGARTAKDFQKSLTGYTHVVVRNVSGQVVVSGTLFIRAAVPSPSP